MKLEKLERSDLAAELNREAPLDIEEGRHDVASGLGTPIVSKVLEGSAREGTRSREGWLATELDLETVIENPVSEEAFHYFIVNKLEKK